MGNPSTSDRPAERTSQDPELVRMSVCLSGTEHREWIANKKSASSKAELVGASLPRVTVRNGFSDQPMVGGCKGISQYPCFFLA